MRILLDTQILVWLLEGTERIGEGVHTRIQQAADVDALFVSAITPWEIAMLVANGRLRLEPLSPAIAVASTRLPWEAHPDPADRILLATARHLDATLITADARILEYGAQGFVKCLAAG
jgi:PIN domain nuclease of toxin-antitoxin system